MPPDKEGAMALQPSVTLLIIDDEPGFARGLARLLHRDGYTLDTADNGQRALAHLQAHRYDLVLCDLRMPELDGRAFYELVLRQYPHLRTRLNFLTGDVLSADIRKFLAQCGQPCLYKPCHAAEVRSAIQQMLQPV
jgi:CheY-like chemotaxis protein